MYNLLLLRPGILPLRPLHKSSPSSFSDVTSTTAASLAPSIFMTAIYHYLILIRAPSALSGLSNRSSSDCVAMYCTNMFFRHWVYSSIIWNPAYSHATAAMVYFHFLSGFFRRSHPVSRCSTWSWNPPRSLLMRGVTT